MEGAILGLSEQEQAERAPNNQRNLEQYQMQLGITDAHLKHCKRVLDLGSGSACSFAHELTDRNKQAEVTCFDYQYHERTPPPHERVQYKAGCFSDTGLPPNHFDLVTSCHAMPSHVGSMKLLEADLREVLRVLSPGGVGYFAPLELKMRVVQERIPLRQVREKFTRALPAYLVPREGEGIAYETRSTYLRYEDNPDIFNALFERAFGGHARYKVFKPAQYVSGLFDDKPFVYNLKRSDGSQQKHEGSMPGVHPDGYCLFVQKND